MTVEPGTALTIAATLALAAIGAFGWMLKILLSFDREQRQARHALRNEIAVMVGETEDRLTVRLERLEEHSLGLRAWTRREHGRGGHE